MKLASWVIALAASSPVSAAEPPESEGSPPSVSSCIECHKELDGAALLPTQHIDDDVHFARGFSCHDCHGGNPAAGQDGDIDAAHDERRGWKKPGRLEVPGFCTRCHADAGFMKRFDPGERVDQLAEYRTSVHGKRNAAGDTKVAVCTDCHGTHPVRAVNDARSPVYPLQVADTCGHCHNDHGLMSAYGVATNQYSGYRASIHARALHEGGDLAAPTCNDCHGSHGAAPPGLDSVGSVCGTCHTREATLYQEITKRKSIDPWLCIQCQVCHEHHDTQRPSAELFGVGPESACIRCHLPGTPIHAAVSDMTSARDRLTSRFREAKELLRTVERAGVEVGADRLALRRAEDQLVELRVLAHSFDHDRYVAVAQDGLAAAEASVAAAGRGFRELRHRRLGLAVSLLVIVAVIVGIFLKIRQLERNG